MAAGLSTSPFANPELRLQKSLGDSSFAAAAFDLRAVPPTGTGTNWVITPGVRTRFRPNSFMRIDVDAYVPVGATTGQATLGVAVPMAVFFQSDNFFIGPETGIFYLSSPGGANTEWIAPYLQGSPTDQTDVHLGVGAGCTIGGEVDLKLELLTARINDSNWNQFVSGSVGIGMRL